MVDRADRYPPDCGDQRSHRRLYRRGGEDSHTGAGYGEGVFSAWSARRTRRKSAPPSTLSCAARLPADAKAEFKSFAGAPATELPFDNPALAKTRAALCRRMGQEGPRDGRGAVQSRSSATSSACWAWIRSWSVSRSTTTACIPPTRSTTSPHSIRARAAGQGSWRRWRRCNNFAACARERQRGPWNIATKRRRHRCGENGATRTRKFA